nr:ATP-binding SpoIIE family protein phosphatase [Streptomyces boncukensis]
MPGNALAAAAARSFAAAALGEWGLCGTLVDDTVLLVSELVSNAVVHAGTAVDLECRLSGGSVVVEVADRHPARAVLSRADEGQGYGLRLVSALAKEWGISYRRERKTVWFRLALTGQERLPPPGGPAASPADPAAPPGPSAPSAPSAPARGHRTPRAQRARRAGWPHVGAEWTSNGALSFLAEASDLLAGHTDEDRVASLAGQLMVPRFADWCAVWLEDTEAGGPPRLARVWHAQEDRMERLRERLRQRPPAPAGRSLPGQALPWPWPDGAAAACRLVVGGRIVGTLVIGREGLLRIPDEVLGLVEDFARRVALAVLSARRYARQASISRILQRGLLPSGEAVIPGLDTAVVYEPSGEGAWAGGDFYDFLELPDGRWRFALGDVQGSGPEAAVVTGLARPVLRLLAREGRTVTETLDRLNREVGEQARFLSLLYGELSFRGADEGGGADCVVACAGHPLPLVRESSGVVRPAALPQLLLGVIGEVAYDSQHFTLRPGDTLLCVTDGVTERRSGRRQFDDGDGLAAVLGGCDGLTAADTAERVRRAVHDFAPGSPTDDLALMVLKIPERDV